MTRKKILLVACASLVLAIASLAFVKREGIAYRIDGWRAGSLMENSLAAGDGGDWKEAERLAMASWQLQSGAIDVLRQWFRASREQRSRHLLVTARSLYEHPKASPEDRREVLGLYLGIGDLVTFRQLLETLAEEEKQHPDVISMAARFALVRGNLERALQLVDLLGRLRQEPRDVLLAAEILTRIPGGREEATNRAQALIEHLFESADPEIALAAFSLLQRIPAENLDGEKFANVGGQLDKLAESVEIVPEHRLLEIQLQMAAEPESRERLVDQAMARFLTEHPAPLISWLLSLGEQELVIEMLPEERARTSPQLFENLVRALLLENEWEKADGLLANAPTGMRPWVVEGMRGAIATAQGENSASRARWERAYQQASLSSGRSALVELARLATRSGNAGIRNRALTEALKRPSAIPMPMADVTFLFSALSKEDNAEDLLVISRNLLATEPENPTLINNVFWLELLSDRVREDLSTKMEDLVIRFPDMTALRSTLALAQIIRGENEKAMTTLEPILSEPEQAASSSDRAVVALALHRTGERARADEFAESVEWSEMLELERIFFQEALGAETSPPQ